MTHRRQNNVREPCFMFLVTWTPPPASQIFLLVLYIEFSLGSAILLILGQIELKKTVLTNSVT